jgi:hypothetical protein
MKPKLTMPQLTKEVIKMNQPPKDGTLREKAELIAKGIHWSSAGKYLEKDEFADIIELALIEARRAAMEEIIESAKQWDASDNYPNDLSEAIKALLKEKP